MIYYIIFHDNAILNCMSHYARTYHCYLQGKFQQLKLLVVLWVGTKKLQIAGRD